MPGRFNPKAIHFVHPEPLVPGPPVFPVFLPFAGCPERCRYCAQDIQTGTRPAALAGILEGAGRALELRLSRSAPAAELAFFGGTFTALPEKDQEACMEFTALWRGRGAVCGARCSTRPDAVTPRGLERLRAAGLGLVELGVQSFHDAALAASNRGYGGRTAEKACRMVLAAGLDLGVQLMPGMPGLSPERAVEDARLAAALRPCCARLYPCLVLEGSALAGDWRAGRYAPWNEEETLKTLAESCRILWGAGVPVIRMGLAPEKELLRNILAGPFHPALGGRARSLALLREIETRLAGWRRSGENAPPLSPAKESGTDFFPDRPAKETGTPCPPDGAAKETGTPCPPDGADRGTGADFPPYATAERGSIPPLTVHGPKRYQGEFWGHRKELLPRYAALGIAPERVFWEDRADFAIRKGLCNGGLCPPACPAGDRAPGGEPATRQGITPRGKGLSHAARD